MGSSGSNSSTGGVKTSFFNRVFWILFAGVVITCAVGIWLPTLANYFKQSGFRSETQDSIHTWVTHIQGEQKWVVLTQTFSHTIERRNERYAWWVYLGNTVVRLRIEDCKVQYYIPTDQVGVKNFEFDANKHKYTVRLPWPKLDETFVDVPSNPDRWTVYKASGWARFDKNELEAQVRRDVRGDILRSVREKGFDHAAELVAKDQICTTLRKVMNDPEATIEVVFAGKP